MAGNFYWANVNRVLTELNISICVSRENMERVETLGGPMIRELSMIRSFLKRSANQSTG
jgi:hypothetical protein